MAQDQVPDWFAESMRRALFMHFSFEATTPPLGAKSTIQGIIGKQVERTAKHTGKRLGDEDALYLIATLVWTELAKAPGSISLTEALGCWRVGEDWVLGRERVDGYEVWNPQSQRYTEFLIDTLARKNRRGWAGRKLLVFMGDDTHMGEKLRNPDPTSDKVRREIGVQPAWDDMNIRKRLLASGMDRACVIREYSARLDG